jgi:hypothetical protein
MPAIRCGTAAGRPWCPGVRLREAFVREQMPHFGDNPPGDWPWATRVPLFGHRRHLQRLPTNGIDDVVDAGHPRHAGEHKVHTGIMLFHGGGGTAIPYHHAIIVLVPGIPQRALDDPGGRIPGEDQGRDAEPPQVNAEIGGVERASGAIDAILSQGILPVIRIGSPGVHVT